jgi:hypothetical protein
MGRIELPKDIDIVKFVQKAYDLSVPQGLGFLHFTDAPLTEDEARQLIRDSGSIAVSLDYVKGRACKMVVHRAQDGSLSIADNWYDHTSICLD